MVVISPFPHPVSRIPSRIPVPHPPDASGRGLGTELYSTLLKELKDRGLHTVMGGIALPNEASVALHEKFGFEKVAQFKQVGNKFGQWIDVAYWQLVFEHK